MTDSIEQPTEENLGTEVPAEEPQAETPPAEEPQAETPPAEEPQADETEEVAAPQRRVILHDRTPLAVNGVTRYLPGGEPLDLPDHEVEILVAAGVVRDIVYI